MSPAPSETKKAARERLAEERAAQAAAERRRERLLRTALIVGVVLVVAGIGLAVVLSQRQTADTNAAKPTGANAETGALPTGTASKPVIQLYEDFQCPACRALEESPYGKVLSELRTQGKVRVDYHILSFLDRNLNNTSSTQSANAAGCVYDQSPQAFIKFHDTVYANQPQQEGVGYTQEQLLTWGKESGVPDQAKFETCVKDTGFAGWVTFTQVKANEAGVTGTPTMYLDGKQVDLTKTSADQLRQQILAAAG